jgi:hypothetical protein
MSDVQESDDSFKAMLNNSTINPGPPAPQVAKSNNNENSCLKPSSLPKVQEAKNKLTEVTKDVYLLSESDEPFEWINTITEKDSLPTTVKELVQLGLVEKEEEHEKLKTKSLEEFLQDKEYQPIIKAFQEIQPSGESKVYLLGEEESVTVLILSIIHDSTKESVIVGLKSLLVQT